MADNDISTDGSGSSPPKHENQIASIMQNPQVVAALQERLGGIVGTSSGYIESLPKPVKRRIKALKNLQFSCTKLEAEFYKEVHALECKYAEKFKPLYEKRSSIITGQYEPTEEECEWESDEEEEDGPMEQDEENDNTEEKLSSEFKKTSLDEVKVDTEELPEDVRGIPEFWFTAMKNVEHIAEMVQEHDEPILKSLTDINLSFIGEEKPSDESTEDTNETSMAFVLEFQFSPNAYFSNSVLTKTYKLSCEVEKDAPFTFEGPEIVGATGCTIDWKKGKNVTQKVIKKKQKHKGKGQAKYVNKTVKNDSFFNFFSPPEVPEDGEMDEETEQLVEADFEIGQFFRERLIPKAVLFFTGEALEDDEEFEEEEEEENEDQDGDNEEDEEEDPDYKPAEGNPPECKQQ